MSTSTPAGSTDRRLLADIGATYARFCIEQERGNFEHIAVLRCAEYAGFVEVVQAYLTSVDGPAPRYAAVAIAVPIDGDHVRMTNRSWEFSIETAQRTLGLAKLLVVNNFTALAMSLPELSVQDRWQVGEGTARAGSVIGLLGPGTGLGVSGVIPSGDRWTTLATEGGHTSFAPTNERELRVLQHAWKTHPHVSAERLVSGPGIELIYQALWTGDEANAPRDLDTAEIIGRALSGASPTCTEALECFCEMLGTVASDVALTLGATGGVYIGGGIVRRLGGFFARSGFRRRFETKGRFSAWLARIPTYVVSAENAALQGASGLLAEHLPDVGGSAPLLDRVNAAKHGLSPAERRVADYVLENPRSVLGDAIGVIATACEVSQPTVIRFCRSLGFQGLVDFKRKLGSGLWSTLPVQRAQVRRQDGSADLCAKVLNNTVSAIVQFRDNLNATMVERATSAMRDARRIEWFAVGHSAVVALDAQYKLLRLRVPTVAHTDPSLLALAAELLDTRDVAIMVSRSGRAVELLNAAAVARERGATVIAVTVSQSPLARRADFCIAVEHGEESTTFVAMISRILHLLVVDMLATGIAVRGQDSGAVEEGEASGSDEASAVASGMVTHVEKQPKQR